MPIFSPFRLRSLLSSGLRPWLLLLPALWSLSCYAVVDIRDFQTTEQQQRYQVLIAELRCPKCQNQNLAGSDSPIAKDLRQELYRLLTEGESDKGIKQFMVARYGDYVLYRPKVQSNTLVLWFGPLAMAVVAFLVIILVLRRQRPEQAGPAKVDTKQLDALLNENNEESNQ